MTENMDITATFQGDDEKEQEQESKFSLLPNDDELSSDEDEDDIKIEDFVDNDILYKFHPEIKNINNSEMEA